MRPYTLPPCVAGRRIHESKIKKKKKNWKTEDEDKCHTYLVVQGGEGYSECGKGKLQGEVTPGIYTVIVAQILYMKEKEGGGPTDILRGEKQ